MAYVIKPNRFGLTIVVVGGANEGLGKMHCFTETLTTPPQLQANNSADKSASAAVCEIEIHNSFLAEVPLVKISCSCAML